MQNERILIKHVWMVWLDEIYEYVLQNGSIILNYIQYNFDLQQDLLTDKYFFPDNLERPIVIGHMEAL